MSGVRYGTKVDSLALELPFQEGLINESHPMWVNGISHRSDHDNYETGSKGRNSYSPKDGCCKIHYVSRGFGAGTKKIRLEIKAKLLGELYLKGITNETLPFLVKCINEIGGGNLFNFSIEDLRNNSYYTDVDITRDRQLPSCITMKQAFDLIISMMRVSPAQSPTNKKEKRIFSSHHNREDVQESYQMPFLLIYDKSLEMQRKGLSSAAALTPLPLIRMETNIRCRKHYEHVTGMKVEKFGDFLDTLEHEDIMNQFFNKATSSWFIRRQIRIETAPNISLQNRLIFKIADQEAKKTGRQVYDFINGVIEEEYFDACSRTKRRAKAEVKKYAEYKKQPKPDINDQYNTLEQIGILPLPYSA